MSDKVSNNMMIYDNRYTPKIGKLITSDLKCGNSYYMKILVINYYPITAIRVTT